MTDGPARYRRAPGLLSRSLPGEVLFAIMGEEGVESLSGTAHAVWGLLEEPRTAEQISGILRSAYRAAPADIDRDVTLLLVDLSARGLVEPVGGPRD